MKKYYHIITIGCQMNVSDSEHLASFLEKEGFIYLPEREKVDLLIINTCGVKQMAEDRAYGLVNKIKKENKDVKIIITGCLSKRDDVKRRLIGKVDWFLPVNDMYLIPDLLKGGDYNPYYSLDSFRKKEGEKYLKEEPKHFSSYSAYIPIGNGCNNFCTYCVVPYARGREVYRPAQEIITEVKALLKKGYKEITLIAQNVNSYNDDDYNFAKLLKEISEIPGDFWLRFSTSHPKDMSDELIEVIGSSDKIAKHLHLALQSGDDEILKAMNRKYTTSHYQELIDKIRKVKPEISITTDIIVGFPGETRGQFENTKEIFKNIGFEMAYISQYSPRPGTASAKMEDDVLNIEKKERFKELNEILKECAKNGNEKYKGKKVRVLIDGKNKRGKYYGKTSSFKTVLIKEDKELKLGDFYNIKIEKALPFGLEGVVC
ncbi:MAG: tRNA (N6-isopentenyl adenosine(37)-C2)-methylthiotransferase MiaB [Patescibacteria group bacterium]|jgi:tRNA-2-methylthio-N6-dimethylallyladenosine synthase|nr:tRNA (N6-isopentenyl adenosine(37)-C2)-methylthiotransferase MiaB [Patescibacteria group bacterium]